MRYFDQDHNEKNNTEYDFDSQFFQPCLLKKGYTLISFCTFRKKGTKQEFAINSKNILNIFRHLT